MKYSHAYLVALLATGRKAELAASLVVDAGLCKSQHGDVEADGPIWVYSGIHDANMVASPMVVVAE